jgi:UDP-2,4-diacetamido-2,4,6-trideoxy-beta-L-altropyranose hydrolase
MPTEPQAVHQDAAPTLLVRADASSEIGTGHVMRCLALAQAWIDTGGRATFACHVVPATLLRRLEGERIASRTMPGPAGGALDAEACIAAARRLGADWVVVDGYHFDAAYHERLRQAGLRTAVIDDNGRLDRYSADLVLNQNLHADGIAYNNRAAWTRLLCGSSYALLRREFRQWRGPARDYPERARSLLVLAGGSDPNDATSRLVEAVLAHTDLRVTAVIGPANPRGAAITQRFAAAAHRLTVLDNVGDVGALMREAEIALSSAGSTVWELALFGAPMILGGIVATEDIAGSRLAQAGGCLYLGMFAARDGDAIAAEVNRLARDRGLRAAIGRKAAALIDGQGASRVVAALRERKAVYAPRYSAETEA